MTFWSRLRRLTPVWQGFLGCVLALALYTAGSWTIQRYREFVVMRDVVNQVQQIFAQQQQAARAQADSKKP